MNGFIKISVKEVGDGHNFNVQTELTDVGIVEKAALLEAFLDGLNVTTADEFAMILMARDCCKKEK